MIKEQWLALNDAPGLWSRASHAGECGRKILTCASTLGIASFVASDGATLVVGLAFDLEIRCQV